MITIGDGASRAVLASTGAELRSWRVGGTELLWQADPAVWGETAPLLFPVVGWTRNSEVTVGGRRYPLGLHGFARRCHFEIVASTANTVVLRTASDGETRSLYPFDWTLDVRVAVSGHALDVSLVVANTGTTTMPYACGLHPGFRWPFDGGEPGDYRIDFAERERDEVPVIDGHGLFTPDRRRIPLQDGRRLPLSPTLFAAEALCFREARSRALRFVHRDGAAIECTFQAFPHLALWSRPPGRFLCIEAWTGYGDEADGGGDLSAKPSMIALAPGDSGTHAAHYRFVPTRSPQA